MLRPPLFRLLRSTTVVVAALAITPAPAALVGAVLATAACNSGPTPVPAAMIGSYAVEIASSGKTDSGIVMTVTVGSNMNVLLTFTAGVYGEIRCQLGGTTMLVLPRQTVEVDHSSGPASGLATGTGSITADGTVDITVTLSADGNVDSGTATSYHITGKKL
jgi:hypothetical protein